MLREKQWSLKTTIASTANQKTQQSLAQWQLSPVLIRRVSTRTNMSCSVNPLSPKEPHINLKLPLKMAVDYVSRPIKKSSSLTILKRSCNAMAPNVPSNQSEQPNYAENKPSKSFPYPANPPRARTVIISTHLHPKRSTTRARRATIVQKTVILAVRNLSLTNPCS